MKQTFLVTGGAGFIGSAVIRHLINKSGHRVVNVDKLTYAGNLESLVDVSDNDRYTFEQVDICDREALDRVFAKHQPDVVMHLAAESHVDRSIDGPSTFIQTNIVGTYTLLEASRSYWSTIDAERKAAFRFHHISTDEVYGDLPHLDDSRESGMGSGKWEVGSGESEVGSGKSEVGSRFSNSQLSTTNSLPLFTEKTPYAPSSPYSASKAGSDHLVRAWHRTYGLPVVITNCSNNYGPYHFPEKLVPLMILNALEGKPLPVYGKGNQVRDWLYVDDHARALMKVATEGAIGETYNIGGHNEKQNIEVVHTICALLDELVPESPHIPHTSLITHVKDRPGHDLRYAIDASKIQRELGWKPEETFESGMRKTVLWYLENREWCGRVRDGSYREYYEKMYGDR